MGRPRIIPDKTTLERWRNEGLTHQQIAERIFEETGHRVTRAGVSAAFNKYGLSPEGKRYERTVPWRVSPKHATANPLKMLRYLGRQLETGDLDDYSTKLLDSWLEKVNANGWIVAYDPDDELGFHYVDKKWKDNRDKLVPIRRKPIHLGIK